MQAGGAIVFKAKAVQAKTKLHGPCQNESGVSISRGTCQVNLWKLSPKIEKVAFVGNYLPRKCGIATFTSDLLTAVTARYPQTQCFAVPVNDVGGRLRVSQRRPFRNRRAGPLVLPARSRLHQHQQRGLGLAYNTSSGFSAGRQEVTCGCCCAN